MRLLVDSDILVDHLRGVRRFDPGDVEVSVSVVTRAELYAGSRADETRIDLLLGPLRELAIDRPIAERAGRLRRSAGLAMPDALIAATALEHGLTVLTRNERHFERVEGLQVRASMERAP